MKLVQSFKWAFKEATGSDFPQDRYDQLCAASGRVRQLDEPAGDRIPQAQQDRREDGHRGEHPGDGVRQYGRRQRHRRAVHPRPLDRRQEGDGRVPAERPGRRRGGRHPHPGADRAHLDGVWPEVHGQVLGDDPTLEQHYRDMVDIEFTVQKGVLYVLQSRSGKRAARGGARVRGRHGGRGHDLKEEAVARIDPAQLDQLLHPRIDPSAGSGCRRRTSTPRRRRLPARSCSTPTPPRTRRRGRASSWCRWRRRRTTSTASCRPPGSSPRTAAHVTPPSSRAGIETPCVTGCEAPARRRAREEGTPPRARARGGRHPVTIDGGTGEVIVAPCRSWRRVG